MAIELNNMRTVLGAMALSPPEGRGRLLILGDAQILFSGEQLVELAREAGYKLHAQPSGTLGPVELGRVLGFAATDTLDVNGKASLTLNLQQEMPSELTGRFSCLIDAGVLFWCFDPGVALKNIFRFVAPGGVFIHITAVSGFYGRCFYNIHPLLFESFYLQNACEYVGSSFYPRPRATSLMQRLKRVFSRGRAVQELSYVSSPGNVYLDEASASYLSFRGNLRRPESEVLPNNAVGTFAFRKMKDVQPQEPLLS